jgi:hypothetical protein
VREAFISAETLCKNLESGYTAEEANDIKSLPEEYAADYVNEVCCSG